MAVHGHDQGRKLSMVFDDALGNPVRLSASFDAVVGDGKDAGAVLVGAEIRFGAGGPDRVLGGDDKIAAFGAESTGDHGAEAVEIREIMDGKGGIDEVEGARLRLIGLEIGLLEGD